MGKGPGKWLFQRRWFPSIASVGYGGMLYPLHRLRGAAGVRALKGTQNKELHVPPNMLVVSWQ